MFWIGFAVGSATVVILAAVAVWVLLYLATETSVGAEGDR